MKLIITKNILINLALLISIIFINSCSRQVIKEPAPGKKLSFEKTRQVDKNRSGEIKIELKQKLQLPLRVLILGDSMIGGYFGLRLTQLLKRIPGVKAWRIYRKSTGLSQYIRYNWKSRSISMIKRFRPDIVVAMFGSNDSLALRLRSGRLIYFKRPGYIRGYRERVTEYLKLISPRVKKLYFVGQPSTNHRSLGRRYPVLNKIYREECRKFSNTVYIPSWEWTSVKNKYVLKMKDRRGKSGLVKSKHDHVHHTPFGGKVLAELLIEFMQRDMEFDYRKGL